MFSGIKFEIAVIALGVLSAVLMTVAVLMMEHARKTSPPAAARLAPALQSDLARSAPTRR